MADATHWIHDLSPFALQLPGGFGVRWYGLAYMVGIVAGWWLIKRWAQRGQVPFRPEQTSDMVLWIGIGMILGGRLGYCLFYYTSWNGDGTVALAPPWAILAHPWDLIAVWKGGMASHFGLLGMVVGAIWWCRRQRVPALIVADLIAATVGIGVFLGRLANFVNGELFGRVSQVSWAVLFPGAVAKHAPSPPELHSPAWYAWVAEWAEPRHPSQLYAAFLEGLLVFACAFTVHLLHRRPGLTASVALVVYAFGRFTGEFFRQPDAGYALYFGWMSKGQLYTLPMFVVAGLIAAYAWRRGPRPAAYRLPEPEAEPS